MHLDDERVQRLLHGELGSAEAETRFHLESCAPCRDLVAGARVEEDRILALLSEVDHPVATLDPRIVLAERNASRGHWGRRAMPHRGDEAGDGSDARAGGDDLLWDDRNLTGLVPIRGGRSD